MQNYMPDSAQMSRGSNTGNQAENLSEGHVANGSMSDPHASTTMGLDICAETNYGIRHGEQVHYDTPTRSDANKD